MATADPCIVCREAPAEGRWELCSGCRSELADLARREQAAMRPEWCMGCCRRRPVPGGIYCSTCAHRFRP